MKREDMEPLEQEVRPWLEKMGIPLENYRRLPPSYKILLHDLVCKRNTPPDRRQLEDLHQKLHSLETRGEEKDTKAVHSLTDDELQKFFSPWPPSDTLSDWEKY